ncbi:hypothetical protein SBDP1_1350009 [Syntrophobacter sp. SbD1]|nr:hypothetical protein SBDP1_1350009 [Syntrophobacter sp. SbD1]
MPIVPTDFVPLGMPGGQPADQDIRAKSEAFDSQVGQLPRKSGTIFEDKAISRRELLDKVSVNDVYATEFDPAARAIYEEYLRLKGKDAAIGITAYQQKMQDLATDIRQRLPNDEQRMRFDEMASHRMQSNLDAMARHQADQTARWIARTGDAMAQALSKRISDERYDFDYVAGPEGLIQGIRNMYASYGRVTGQDPAASALKAATAIDRGLSDAVLTEAATNPAGAKILYDRYESYMSSTAVRRHVLNHLLPAIRQEQTAAVYNDVIRRFNLSDPDSDIHAATKWVMDPNNYQDQLAGPDQRNDAAKTIQGAWNRARQLHEDNQSSADSNFTDAVAKREIAGMGLQTWRDSETGLQPSSGIVRAALEHDANPTAPGASDRDTLVSLAHDLSNRRMNSSGPIDKAYLRNLVTHRDFRELRGLYETYRDPAKSRWFDSAKTAYYSRYADPNGPNGVNADAMKLFPQYLTDLDQAVRDQNLKGAQIRESADKMLKDTDRALVGQWFGNTALGP